MFMTLNFVSFALGQGEGFVATRADADGREYDDTVLYTFSCTQPPI